MKQENKTDDQRTTDRSRRALTPPKIKPGDRPPDNEIERLRRALRAGRRTIVR
jgi:hypothetical protein